MTINEEYITLFESFTSGKMSATNVTSFEARLDYDSEFKEQFVQYQKLENELNLYFSEKTKFKLKELDKRMELKKSITQPTEKSKPSGILRKFWIPISVAASIILVFTVAITNSGNAHEELAESYWIKDPGLPVKMSSQNSYDQAMNQYKLKNWELSLEELKKIPSDTSSYFQGQVLFQMNKDSQAISVLEKVPTFSVYSDKSEFSIALLLLRTGKLEEAKNLLSNISEGNSEYAIKAKKLLSEI